MVWINKYSVDAFGICSEVYWYRFPSQEKLSSFPEASTIATGQELFSFDELIFLFPSMLTTTDI